MGRESGRVSYPAHRWIGNAQTPYRLTYVCRRNGKNRQLERGGALIVALATTLTETPGEWVQLYERRGEVGNRIRELNSGVAVGRLPSMSFESNAVWEHIGGDISCNLGIGLARALFPTHRITVETLRWYALTGAGRLTNGGRPWCLELVREVREEMAE